MNLGGIFGVVSAPQQQKRKSGRLSKVNEAIDTLSAITPRPTQRRMPSSPGSRQRRNPCLRLSTLIRPPSRFPTFALCETNARAEEVSVRHWWFFCWAATSTARSALVPLSRSRANKLSHRRPPCAGFVPISVGASGSRTATESSPQGARRTRQSGSRLILTNLPNSLGVLVFLL